MSPTVSLGATVIYVDPEGVKQPAIVVEDSDEGRTVGLCVFGRHPFYVNNYVLPDDVTVLSAGVQPEKVATASDTPPADVTVPPAPSSTGASLGGKPDLATI